MGGGWKTTGFLEAFDRWCEQESPSTDLRVVVLHWVMTRATTPYLGVTRVDGFPNLWFGAIPETDHGDRVVTCSYWVAELEREVRCDILGTLTRPL